MNTGTITKTNTKGQMVIPKNIRDVLGIDYNIPLNIIVKGAGFYVYPIRKIMIGNGNDEDIDSSYPEILNKTRGAWQNEDWGKIEKRRHNIELKDSRTRQQLW